MSNSYSSFFKFIIFLFSLVFAFLFSVKIPLITAQTCNENGTCESGLGENCLTCEEDCGECSECGDDVCQEDENCSNCPNDCGDCPAPTPGATPAPSTPDSPEPYTGPVRYPLVSLNSVLPDPTNKTTLSFSGTASIEHGVIDLVQYSVDSTTAWVNANAADGEFDSISERFIFTPKLSFPEGKHTVYVRARSLSRVYTTPSNYASDTFTVATTSPEVILNKISPNPTDNQTPTISGIASSRLVGISKAEISFDEGNTWLPADLSAEKFILTVEKQFKDGNYPVLARAIDTAGNIGKSELQTLIIDTIPPIIGGNMVALGPQVLLPNKSGVVQIVVGAKTTIATSMKGGVTEASVIAKEKTFPLTHIVGTNLWSGEMLFDKPGEKILKISAVDGAGNKTERELNSLQVENFGQVVDKESGNLVVNAEVSVFFFDQSTSSWALWEGRSYGQKNPQKTGKTGLYSFMIPSGRYYLEVKAPGFKTMQSEILEPKQVIILNPTFPLTSRPEIRFNLPILGEVVLTLPWLYSPETLPVSEFSTIASTDISSELILQQGVDAPEFSLPDRDGKLISPINFSERAFLLTFVAFWSPHSEEQIPILNEVNQSLSEGYSMLGIALQESKGATESFMQRGNYTFPIASDKNGESAADYKITNLPQHFFINSSGKIQETYIGVLTKEELLNKLYRSE